MQRLQRNPIPESIKATVAGMKALYGCSSDDAGNDMPASQRERNEAFLNAVRAGRTDIARALASATPPDDATDAERVRWRIRRRLYRPRLPAASRA